MDDPGVPELAERAGVTPSTARFYVHVGLLPPERRAPNGYRAFEETAREELAFVTRAKGIGMAQRDITDLLAAWPRGQRQTGRRAGTPGRADRRRTRAAGRAGRPPRAPAQHRAWPPLGKGPRTRSLRQRTQLRNGVGRTRWRHRARHPEGRSHSDRHPGSTRRRDGRLRPDPLRRRDRRRARDACPPTRRTHPGCSTPCSGHRPRRPMTSSQVALVVVALRPRLCGSGRLPIASAARLLTAPRAHLSADGANMSADPVWGGCGACEPALTAG